MKNLKVALIGVLFSVILIVVIFMLIGKDSSAERERLKEEAESLLTELVDEELSYVGCDVLSKHKASYKFNYKVEGRELYFSVNTFIEKDERKYVTDYIDVIMELYVLEMDAYLKEALNTYDSTTKTIKVTDKNIGDVAKALSVCENIYSPENKYHTYTFTSAYPNIVFKLIRADGSLVMEYHVEGVNDEIEIMDWLVEMYLNDSEEDTYEED